jgi:hypothetical protein
MRGKLPNRSLPSIDNQVRIEYLPLSSLKLAKRNPKRHHIETVAHVHGALRLRCTDGLEMSAAGDWWLVTDASSR